MAEPTGKSPIETVQFLPVLIGTSVTYDKGDALWWDEANVTVKKASDFTWDTNENITRQQFKRRFVGFANDFQRSGDPARVAQVINVSEADEAVTSSTLLFSPETGNSLVGLEKASGNNLENQIFQTVSLPSEAIGMAIQDRAAAVTTVRVLALGGLGGMGALRGMNEDVLYINVAEGGNTAQDLLTDVDPAALFGGAVELLAINFLETTAVTVADMVLTIDKAAVALAATLTVPAAGAAIGRVTEQSLAADAARFFLPNDTITIKTDGGSTAGAGVIGLRYRRLS